jgi:hypothetical protein
MLPGGTQRDKAIPKEQKDSAETEKTEGILGKPVYKTRLNHKKNKFGSDISPYGN